MESNTSNKNIFDIAKSMPSFDKLMQEKNKTLRELFKDKIKGSFLIKILSKVKECIGLYADKYYDFSITSEKMVTRDMTSIDYEICKMIIGIHRSNTLFLNDDELAKRQKDELYKKELIDAVIMHIKLRNYAAVFFRNKPIFLGEEFIYYPVPYKLFSLAIKSNFLLSDNKENCDGIGLSDFYIKIINKTITALSLLEDNMFDSVYPICRAIIEIYLKLTMVEFIPGLLEEYNKFIGFEIERANNKGTYSKNFNDTFSNRKNKNEKAKHNYLFFGWVDRIKDYHEIVKRHPYSIEGICSFLKSKIDFNFFDTLNAFYNKCHPYTHGNASSSEYPLIDYFDISVMLSLTTIKTYELLCKHLNIYKKIENMDVLETLNKDVSLLILQKKDATIDKLNNYYNKR